MLTQMESNDQYDLVSGATACCWVLAKSKDDAHRKAVFEIEKYDWKITDYVSYAVEVTRDDFVGKDVGLESYDKAQKYSRAVVYIAVARDGKTKMGPIELRPRKSIDLAEFMKQQKRNRQRGRCFHYAAGDSCSDFSMAHSIQKSRMLSVIARNGHVYGLNHDFGALKKNAGRQSYKEIGINEISTFFGFCGKHDNELFRPIDDCALVPTNEQAMLYGYRSLCKELFAKQNAIELYNNEVATTDQPAVRDMFLSMAEGTYLGLKELEAHKELFDQPLKHSNFEEARYVLFRSSNRPNVVFSGLMYPDYDFSGNELQSLGDPDAKLDLITYSSAWMERGWGFLFVWHSKCAPICERFISSLKQAAADHGNYQDFLFRLAVGCENHAISPEWWEGLPSRSRNLVVERISDVVDVLSDVESKYLSVGLEGISDWKFDDIVSNIGIGESL